MNCLGIATGYTLFAARFVRDSITSLFPIKIITKNELSVAFGFPSSFIICVCVWLALCVYGSHVVRHELSALVFDLMYCYTGGWRLFIQIYTTAMDNVYFGTCNALLSHSLSLLHVLSRVRLDISVIGSRALLHGYRLADLIIFRSLLHALARDLFSLNSFTYAYAYAVNSCVCYQYYEWIVVTVIETDSTLRAQHI